MIKYLIIENNGFKFAIPAEIIAKDRASHYKDESAESYKEEFEYTMSDHSVIEDWFWNNMNWKDVSENSILIKSPSPDFDPTCEGNTDDAWIENIDNVKEVSSKNIKTDIDKFIKKYKFDEEEFTEEKLKFRMTLLKEEYEETLDAYNNKNSEEWVDGHIDLIVIAVGNLKLAGIDIEKAWEQVFSANMSKVRGVKPGRESSGGFDIIKPEGWKSPDHSDNHGLLTKIWEKEDGK